MTEQITMNIVWSDKEYSIRQVDTGWYEVYEKGITRRGIFHFSNNPEKALQKAHQRVKQLRHGKSMESLYCYIYDHSPGE